MIEQHKYFVPHVEDRIPEDPNPPARAYRGKVPPLVGIPDTLEAMEPGKVLLIRTPESHTRPYSKRLRVMVGRINAKLKDRSYKLSRYWDGLAVTREK